MAMYNLLKYQIEKLDSLKILLGTCLFIYAYAWRWLGNQAQKPSKSPHLPSLHIIPHTTIEAFQHNLSQPSIPQGIIQGVGLQTSTVVVDSASMTKLVDVIGYTSVISTKSGNSVG